MLECAPRCSSNQGTLCVPRLPITHATLTTGLDQDKSRLHVWAKKKRNEYDTERRRKKDWGRVSRSVRADGRAQQSDNKQICSYMARQVLDGGVFRAALGLPGSTASTSWPGETDFCDKRGETGAPLPQVRGRQTAVLTRGQPQLCDARGLNLTQATPILSDVGLQRCRPMPIMAATGWWCPARTCKGQRCLSRHKAGNEWRVGEGRKKKH